MPFFIIFPLYLSENNQKNKQSHVNRPGLEAVFDGNEDLLAFMYRTYADSLYVYGLSFHSDMGMIEDAIHDVFIDVYVNEKRFADISNLRQYLKTAFRHRLLFLLQDNKRYVEVFNEASDLFAAEKKQSGIMY